MEVWEWDLVTVTVFLLSFIAVIVLTVKQRWTGSSQWPLLSFSHSVISNSLQPHGLQHTKFPSSSHLMSSVHWVKMLNSCPLNQWCHPTIFCCHLLLPSIFLSVRDFSNELALHIRWPKYWSFSFSISPSNWGLIYFRTDWFDLLASKGLLHHNLKASVLWHSAFFIIQLSHRTWLLEKP